MQVLDGEMYNDIEKNMKCVVSSKAHKITQTIKIFDGDKQVRARNLCERSCEWHSPFI